MRFLSIIFCCGCLLAGGTVVKVKAQERPDDDVVRTESDLTNLLFTATDKNRRFITTLRQEDIRVFEDGVAQQLFTFQRETDRPLAVGLVIDVSASEERTLPQEKGAARSFVETIIRSSKDEVAVIPFTGNAYLEQGLTRDVLSIYRALERTEVALPDYLGSGRPIRGLPIGPGTAAPREGSTAIWDAVFLTARQILALSQGQRRRAIILLTDGQNTSGHLGLSAAIDQAIESETIVYTVGIGDARYGGVDEGVLKTLAERTGGRAFFPKKDADLTAAFEAIQQELRTQYLLAYSSSNKKRDGKVRQLKIEVTNPDLLKEQLKLRYRPGYVVRP